MPYPARNKQASLLLGRPVSEFIAERRADGMGWAAIAGALAHATDGEVAVSHTAVKAWHDAALAEQQPA